MMCPVVLKASSATLGAHGQHIPRFLQLEDDFRGAPAVLPALRC